MSRYWLVYKQGSRFAGVVIVDADSLRRARKRASSKTRQKLRFASYAKLLVELAELVPTRAVGRMLSPTEAGKLIRRFERRIREQF
jgi:hypothetical protein